MILFIKIIAAIFVFWLISWCVAIACASAAQNGWYPEIFIYTLNIPTEDIKLLTNRIFGNFIYIAAIILVTELVVEWGFKIIKKIVFSNSNNIQKSVIQNQIDLK